MKRIRRITALLLALLMLLPSFAALAEGAEPGDVTPAQTETAPPAEETPDIAPPAEETPEPPSEEAPPAPAEEEPPAPAEETTPAPEAPVETPQPETDASNIITVTAQGGASFVVLGETLQLTATVSPESADDQSVAWRSSDEAILSVDATGLVTAHAIGEATVTAALADGVSGSIALTVRDADEGEETGEIPSFDADQTVSTEAELIAALSSAVSGDTITMGADITLSANATVANGVTLAVGQGCTLTVAENATLTVAAGGFLSILYDEDDYQNSGILLIQGTHSTETYGHVIVEGTFDNGGYIENHGEFLLQGTNPNFILWGPFINKGITVIATTTVVSQNAPNGKFTNNDWISYTDAAGLVVTTDAYATDTATLVAKLADWRVERIHVTSDINLTENASIPSGKMVFVEHVTLAIGMGRALTIEEDGALVIEGKDNTPACATVSNNGRIVNNGSLTVRGQLDNTGSIETGARSNFFVEEEWEKNGNFGYVKNYASAWMTVRNLTVSGEGKIEFLGNSIFNLLGCNNFANFFDSSVLTVSDTAILNLTADDEGNAGINLSSGATMNFGGDASFTSTLGTWFDNNGTIHASSAGAVSIGGSFLNTGTITGNGAGKFLSQINKARVTTFAELKDALDNPQIMEASVIANIAISENLTIPEDKLIVVAGPNRLTVNSGITFTVEESGGLVLERYYGSDPTLTSAVLDIRAGGTFINNGFMNLWHEAKIECAGTLTIGETGSIGTNPGSALEITGTLNVFGELKIEGPQIRLTFNNGSTLNLKDNGIIHNYGVTQFLGTVTVSQDENAVFFNHAGGTITNPPSTLRVKNGGTVTTEADLRTAMADATLDEIVLAGNVALTANLNVVTGKTLIIENGYTLTVPAGITLETDWSEQGDTGDIVVNGTLAVNGTLLNDAGIYVENGGVLTLGVGSVTALHGPLENRGGGTVNVDSTATVTQYGPADNAYGFFFNSGTLNQSTEKLVANEQNVTAEDALTRYLPDWRVQKVIVTANITVAADIAVPAEKELIIGEAATLTLNGLFIVEEDGNVVIDGALVLGNAAKTYENNGYIHVQNGAIRTTVAATFVNRGTVQLDSDTVGLSFAAGTFENRNDLSINNGSAEFGAGGMLHNAGYGYVTVNDGSTLRFLTGSAIKLVRDTTILVLGTATFANDVTVTYDPADEPGCGAFIQAAGATVTNPPAALVVTTRTDVSTFAALQSALANDEVKSVRIVGSMAITAHITIPDGKRVETTPGVTLTVNPGTTVTIADSARLDIVSGDGSAKLVNNGRIVNNGIVSVRNTFENKGIYESGPDSLLAIEDYWDETDASSAYGSVVNSGNASMQLCDFEAQGNGNIGGSLICHDNTQLLLSGSYNSAQFHSGSVLTVDGRSTLKLEGTDERNAGLTIDGNATMHFEDNATLDSNEFGWFDNYGSILAPSANITVNIGSNKENGGSFSNSGTIDGAGAGKFLSAVNKRNLSTFADLKAALADTQTSQIIVVASIAISENLTIPANKLVVVGGPSKLTVNSGITLTIEENGGLVLERNWNDDTQPSAELEVLAGGTVELGGVMNLWPRATIMNAGTFTIRESGWLGTNEGAAITNSGTLVVNNHIELTNCTLTNTGSMTVRGSVITRGGAIVNVTAGTVQIENGGWINFGGEGTAMNLSGGSLVLAGGGTIELGDHASFTKSGSASVAFNGGTFGILAHEGVTVSGVPTSEIVVMYYAQTGADVKTAVEDASYTGYKSRLVFAYNETTAPLDILTLDSDVTVPADCELRLTGRFDEETGALYGTLLNIAAGKTLTNNGKIRINAWVNEAGDEQIAFAELMILGTLDNKSTIEVYGRLTRGEGGRYLGRYALLCQIGSTIGTASEGIPTRTRGVEAEGVSVTQAYGVHTLPKLDASYQFEATVLPANTEDQAVTWSIVDANGSPVTVAGVALSGAGLLTVTGASVPEDAAFFVQAATANAKKSSYAITVKTSPARITYEGDPDANMAAPIEVFSGDTLQLQAALGADDSPSFGFAFSSTDSNYASVTATGLVTTRYLVTEQTVEITMIPNTTDAPEGYTYTRTLKIKPALTSIAITSDGNDVTGTALPINLNGLSAMTFDSVKKPNNSIPATYAWTLTDPNGVFTLTGADTASAVLTPTGTKLLGDITLRCIVTAGGASLSAIVTLKPYFMATAIEIVKKDLSPLPTNPTVTAGGALELGSRVVGDQVANKQVTWKLRTTDAVFASISGAGKLSTKSGVTTTTIVEVTATTKDGSQLSDTREITIVPRATDVTITDGDGVENLTGTTVYVDSADTKLLSTIANPVDASGAVAWSPMANRYATLRVIPDGADAGKLEITPIAGASGSFALTAKATDGSNKSARVTIKVGKFIKDVAFDGNTEPVEAGTKRQLSVRIVDPVPPVTPTSATYTWSIDPEYKSYATITGKGLLTVNAKTVFEDMVIPVLLTAKDTGTVFECDVNAKPANVLVIRDAVSEENFTGTTQFINITGAGNAITLEMAKAVNNADALTETVWRPNASNRNVRVAVNGDQMTLTGLKAGTVAVTATAKIGGVKKTATMKVTVRDPISNIRLDLPTAKNSEGNLIPLDFVASGKALQINAFTTTSAGIKKGNSLVSWALSGEGADKAVITASGKLTAGKTLLTSAAVTVTATAKDGSGTEKSVDIMLHPSATAVVIGQTESGQFVNKTGQTLLLDRNDSPREWQLDSQVIPNPGDGSLANQSIVWKSSNVRLVTVDANGLLTPGPNFAKGGSASITATTLDGSRKSATVKVMVTELVTALSLTFPASTPLTPTDEPAVMGGKTLKCGVSFGAGLNPTNKKVAWWLDASDAVAATISTAGVVKAKKVTQPTKITIHCKSLDGSNIEAEANAFVYPATTAVAIRNSETDVVLTGKTVTLHVGDELRIDGYATPTLALPNANAAVFKIVDKATIASCVLENSAAGTFLITARGVGRTTISLTAMDGSNKRATVTIVVVR